MTTKLSWNKETGSYDVIVDGQRIGRVQSFEERTTHTAGRLAIGYSYAKRWNAYDKTGRRVGFGSFRTRKDAAEWLIDNQPKQEVR